jgi:hypothetical protein
MEPTQQIGESVWIKPANFYSVVEGPRLPARLADLPVRIPHYPHQPRRHCN